MFRGARAHGRRAAAVWLLVTTVAAGAVAVAAPAIGAPDSWTSATTFDGLLVRVCALALVLAVLRLWTITTATVAQLLRGRPLRARGATSRLVLLACGAVLATGAAAPATADGGDDGLGGLRLPERTVGPPGVRVEAGTPALPVSARLASASVHVVRPGESLWSIAEATSPPGTDLDLRWRSIWAANRHAVGDDPHLIHPGQRLLLPATGETSDETGDRP